MTDLSGTKLQPCGDKITFMGMELLDEKDHKVIIVHADEVESMYRQLANMRAIHQIDHGFFFPLCLECGTVWPCTTERARLAGR
jgi:hypothetical protein